MPLNDEIQTLLTSDQTDRIMSNRKSPATAAKDVALSEFLSLPLSVQLGALLARNLSTGAQQQPSSSDPQSAYLAALTRSIASTSGSQAAQRSRTIGGGKSESAGQRQQVGSQGNSRGSTLSRHQIKLHNLEGLISRLQRLHEQTMQQQLAGGSSEGATGAQRSRSASRTSRGSQQVRQSSVAEAQSSPLQSQRPQTTDGATGEAASQQQSQQVFADRSTASTVSADLQPHPQSNFVIEDAIGSNAVDGNSNPLTANNGPVNNNDDDDETSASNNGESGGDEDERV